MKLIRDTLLLRLVLQTTCPSHELQSHILALGIDPQRYKIRGFEKQLYREIETVNCFIKSRTAYPLLKS